MRRMVTQSVRLLRGERTPLAVTANAPRAQLNAAGARASDPPSQRSAMR